MAARRPHRHQPSLASLPTTGVSALPENPCPCPWGAVTPTLASENMKPCPLGGRGVTKPWLWAHSPRRSSYDDRDKPPQTGCYRMPLNLTKGGPVFELLHLGRERLTDFGRRPSKRLSRGGQLKEPHRRTASPAGDLRVASAEEEEASPSPASRALRGSRGGGAQARSSRDRAGIGRWPTQCHRPLSP